MKQFNLQEFFAHPERKVVTRDGRKVRIVCTDRAGLYTKPIVALITLPNGDEVIKTFWDNGIETAGSEDKNDLFFASEKHEGYVNIIRNVVYNEAFCGKIYDSKEEAESKANNATLATARIEWEE